jgi:hypothetical protein
LLNNRRLTMKKYEVKMTSDAVGYYVVEVIHGIELYIKGTSHSKKEMLDLAAKLNSEEKAAQ